MQTLFASRRAISALPHNHHPTRPGVESLEPRRFLSVSTWTASSISALDGYSYGTDLILGDSYSIPQLNVGTSSSYNADFFAWDADADPSNGIDSGTLDFNFTCDVSGSTDVSTLSGSSLPTVSWNGSGISTISEVKIRAGVATSGYAFIFSNLSIKFYHNGTLSQTDTVGSLSADRRSYNDNQAYEAGATITPSANDINKVVVTGNMRLAANSDTPQNYDDVVGTIRVFT